jgi:hypothetical protein
VGWPLLIFGAVLILVLWCVATVYFVRQVRALRRLRNCPEPPDDEMTYQRGQARRRLAGSLLMFLLAVLLAGHLVFLEGPAQQLAEQYRAARAENQELPLSPFARFFIAFWIFFLLVLLAVVVLAALDLWATRRYAVRERQKIRDDRRAMVAEELARLRREREDYY